MIRQLSRDLAQNAMVLIPFNVLAAGVLVGGSLASDALGSGWWAVVLLLIASMSAGIITLGMAAAAGRYVERGRAVICDVTDGIRRGHGVLRGAGLGLVTFALPVMLLGQLDAGLTRSDTAMIAAPMLGLVIILCASPLVVLMTVAMALHPGRSINSLLNDALATIAADVPRVVRLGVFVLIVGGLSATTIAPMLTVFTSLVCLLGARVVVAPEAGDCKSEASFGSELSMAYS